MKPVPRNQISREKLRSLSAACRSSAGKKRQMHRLAGQVLAGPEELRANSAEQASAFRFPILKECLMTRAAARLKASPASLPKCTTGIHGLDEITGGGLPQGRPTLVCGGAGCGKTLLGIEFLVRGATRHQESGVFIAFEETAEELAQNVRSLGFDLDDLIEKKMLAVDYVHIERSEIEETGDYDLEGLFIRLGYAIDSIGAKRVVLDSLETLFSGLANVAILRAEMRRLFRWLKEKGVTAIITAERGNGSLTRHGLEEYVSDCVLLLDHRVEGQISTRRLRIVKYRGSSHSTNEFPFLIDEGGISVLPITSILLRHQASSERISSGVPALDAMLGGPGFFRGSSVLVSGTAGIGKTSLACHAANACCHRGERCLFFSFEESEAQLLRNMRSISLDLGPWVKQESLRIHAGRPTTHGLEMHLAGIHKQVEAFQPDVVVVDPITNFISAGTASEASSMMMRLVDYLKTREITAVLTTLNHAGSPLEQTELGISSLIDTWLLLRDIELNGERNRGLYIIKSRGMAHSNQIREFLLTDHGVQLTDVYLGPEGVLTGSARLAQEAKAAAAEAQHQQNIERKRRELSLRQQSLEAQIAALQSQVQIEREELERDVADEQEYAKLAERSRNAMSQSRKSDLNGRPAAPRKVRK